MINLDTKQTFCGTCKDWINDHREVNCFGKVLIPETYSESYCQNQACYGRRRQYNQICPCFRPLNI